MEVSHVMESFFHSFKGEWMKNRYFSSERNLRAAIRGYIQDFYNPIRLHSSLGYRSPDEFEAMALWARTVHFIGGRSRAKKRRAP